MRIIFIILFLISCIASTIAQEGKVPNALLSDYGWLDGNTAVIFGHPTTMIYGQVTTKRETVSGYVTNVGYVSLSQTLESLGKIWKATDKSSEYANRMADSLRNVVPGGYVYLYIERPIENSTNLQYFFIIIRDKNDKTVYSKYFTYKAPNIANGIGTWWNYVATEIPVELEYPFYIYVNDKQSEYLSDFKFRIEDVTANGTVEIFESTLSN
ncbi:MAG: hypothetical protein LBH92_02255 [Bacteroidales bacterium]|jgi:hypothetical protein|nr:hypothetical protein [Bacteroidales bacterium]